MMNTVPGASKERCPNSSPPTSASSSGKPGRTPIEVCVTRLMVFTKSCAISLSASHTMT